MFNLALRVPADLRGIAGNPILIVSFLWELTHRGEPLVHYFLLLINAFLAPGYNSTVIGEPFMTDILGGFVPVR